MRYIKYILVILFVLFIGDFVWRELYLIKFVNPEFDSISEEVDQYTGFVLKKGDNVLFGKRSRPDSSTGDYSSCYIIQLDQARFHSFQEVVVKTDRINYDSGCHTYGKFTDQYEKFQFEFYAYRKVTPDEFYFLMVDMPQRVLFITMTSH